MPQPQEGRNGSARSPCSSPAVRREEAWPPSARRGENTAFRVSGIYVRSRPDRNPQVQVVRNVSTSHKDNHWQPSGPEVVEYHDRTHDQGGRISDGWIISYDGFIAARPRTYWRSVSADAIPTCVLRFPLRERTAAWGRCVLCNG